ncbi:MAG: 6-phosphogluconate dehydrogenase [Alphaproteobacteria bacterium]|jgi:6-phosphogluconate dehydrogenase
MSTPTSSNGLCDVGFIGLGVMGKNLALNLADNGYKVACFDLDHGKVNDALQQDKIENKTGHARLIGCKSYTELLANIKAPHTIILSVPAGEPVDHVCGHLIDAGIHPDDIVVDTGNSLWTDSVERESLYKGKFVFFSTAVSGGEEGARFGPSLMPSGDPYAWTRIEPLWNAIAAKVDPATGKPIENYEIGKPVTEGEPCTTYIGPVGAGHYVKMVHNGIEYADMQLICEVYHVMRDMLNMSAQEVSDVFKQWNSGLLDSYLMQISAQVLAQRDPENPEQALVDIILDKAGQKGTGLWTAVSALQVGSPAQTITQAVFARSLSSFKVQRVEASKVLAGPDVSLLGEVKGLVNGQVDKQTIIGQLHDALYCAKICAYAQGFQLMAIAGKEHGWQLDFAKIAKIWRAGCIIRAVFLQSITHAYENNEHLENLLLDPFFVKQVEDYQSNWRRGVANACLAGVPTPALSSSLNYYDSFRCNVLPANLLQGQRDFFGAHTYSRIDKPEHHKYHLAWGTDDRTQTRIRK